MGANRDVLSVLPSFCRRVYHSEFDSVAFFSISQLVAKKASNQRQCLNRSQYGSCLKTQFDEKTKSTELKHIIGRIEEEDEE